MRICNSNISYDVDNIFGEQQLVEVAEPHKKKSHEMNCFVCSLHSQTFFNSKLRLKLFRFEYQICPLCVSRVRFASVHRSALHNVFFSRFLQLFLFTRSSLENANVDFYSYFHIFRSYARLCFHSHFSHFNFYLAHFVTILLALLACACPAPMSGGSETCI